MCTVREVLCGNATGEVNLVEGWLVLLGDKVCLTDMRLDQPWQSTPAIELDIDGLQFALMLQLAQVGGPSIFFHQALVSGMLNGTKLKPTKIRAKDAPKQDWMELDFSENTISRGREQYVHLTDQSEEMLDFWSTPSSSS